jgi:hypothetical protein
MEIMATLSAKTFPSLFYDIIIAAFRTVIHLSGYQSVIECSMMILMNKFHGAATFGAEKCSIG